MRADAGVAVKLRYGDSALIFSCAIRHERHAGCPRSAAACHASAQVGLTGEPGPRDQCRTGSPSRRWCVARARAETRCDAARGSLARGPLSGLSPYLPGNECTVTVSLPSASPCQADRSCSDCWRFSLLVVLAAVNRKRCLAAHVCVIRKVFPTRRPVTRARAGFPRCTSAISSRCSSWRSTSGVVGSPRAAES